MSTLDGLPPDLLVLILHAVNSPRDLHSLISASRPCLAVFLSTRNLVLISVLRNAIPPEALRHALAAASAPHPVVGVAELPTRSPEPNLDTVEPFLETYFSTDAIGFPKDIAGLISLCGLYSQVSRLSNEYFLRATRLLAIPIGPGDPAHAGDSGPQDGLPEPQEALPEPKDAPVMSRLEMTRLYRAFFRYELFCRLFPPQYVGTAGAIDRVRKFHLFPGRMEPWEVEEMSCVHGYLIFLIEGFIKDMEAQLMAAVLNSPGVQIAEGDKLSKDSTGQPSDSNKEEMVPFDDLELRGLSLYEATSKRRVPRFIAKLAGYGLDYVTKLQRASPRDLRDIIRSEDFFPRTSLPDVLDLVVVGPYDDSPAPAGDDVSRANPGYRMRYTDGSRHYHGIFDQSSGIPWDPLRERGYVFWDAARSRGPEAKRRVAEAVRLPREEIATRHWRVRKSVEERLRGVRLRKSEMQRVIREFSDWHGEEDDSDVEL